MNKTASIPIGKIVKSNTHVDYVCQVYNQGEQPILPQVSDYSFGSFVSIQLDQLDQRLIGVIYNTLLMNPDFGNLGPRLSPRPDLEIFSPDYLAETATLVGIIAVGWQQTDGSFRQGVPIFAATLNNEVQRLSNEELINFHQERNGRGQPQMRLRYAPLLLNMGNPLIPPLLINIIDQLSQLFPDQARQLAVMRNNLAWKSIVQPAG
ncbi:MAG: hypothetical protein U0175_08180 [Caldilineaceae bacterium]